jgi:hypothetical protein
MGSIKPDGTREHRYSCLDYVYSTSDMEVGVTVLEDSSSDHRPVLAKAILNICRKPRLGTIRRQKFKGLAAAEVDQALDNGTDWSLVHDIMDVNAVHQFITGGITRAMDVFAPLKDISVKDGNDVYLSEETLSMMRVRDTAKGDAYHKAKKRVTALVRRDKVLANTRRLAESKNCPRVPWEISNAAIGKQRPSLPASVTAADGSKTVGPLAAATAQNAHYIDKIDVIRDKLASAPPPPPSTWPRKTFLYQRGQDHPHRQETWHHGGDRDRWHPCVNPEEGHRHPG